MRYVNVTYQRHGGLWDGRHKGHIVQSQTYFLACMRYIEMNPVRAGMLIIQPVIVGLVMRRMPWVLATPLLNPISNI